MDIDILLKEFEKKGFDPMLNEIVLGRLAFVLKTLKKYKELRKIPFDKTFNFFDFKDQIKDKFKKEFEIKISNEINFQALFAKILKQEIVKALKIQMVMYTESFIKSFISTWNIEEFLIKYCNDRLIIEEIEYSNFEGKTYKNKRIVSFCTDPNAKKEKEFDIGYLLKVENFLTSVFIEKTDVVCLLIEDTFITDNKFVIEEIYEDIFTNINRLLKKER
jgi:hypothetical protein